MAAKSSATKPKPPDRVSAGRIEERKPKPGPVRRHENGLLDVTRKSGKHVNTIKSNSQTPLLRLPPEIRNQIWGYALGHREVDISEPLDRRYTSKRAKIIFQSPVSSYQNALLRVCRQIYAEAALLPYSLNSFLVNTNTIDDWVTNLQEAQRTAISHIQLEASEFWHIEYTDFCQLGQTLADCLKLHLLPGLRKLIIDYQVNQPFRDLFEKELARFRTQIRDVRPELEVVWNIQAHDY